MREDVLTHFAKKQDNVGEDVTIPAGSDVMILREARYLKTQMHHHEYRKLHLTEKQNQEGI